MKRRSLFALAVAVSIAAVPVTLALVVRQRSMAAPPAPATPVTAAVAKTRDVPAIIRALGTVEPLETVAVQSRVSGQIVRTYFTPGRRVTQGQPLFLIDPRPYQAALRQAQGQLAKDTATLQQAEADLARYQKLARENSIAQQQAQDQVYTVKQDQGTVTVDQANVVTAQLNLGYCHIDAPAAGLAGPLLVDPGNYVTAGAGMSLVTITQLQPIYVNFAIPETSLAQVRRYQAATPLAVEAYSQSGKKIAAGKLSLIDNQVNATTDTVMLQATFSNRNEALWPGAFVSTRLVVYIRKNVVTVPGSTVMTGPTGPYVYVIEPGDTVKRVDVEVVARQAGIDVIAKGLSAGERVVTDGQYRLANDAKVAIRPSAAATGNAASVAAGTNGDASGS